MIRSGAKTPLSFLFTYSPHPPKSPHFPVLLHRYLPPVLFRYHLLHRRYLPHPHLPRQKEARPLIDALLACLEESVDKVPNKSKIAIAIRYVLTHRTQLTNYLLDGNCSISNNLAERSIRPFTVGRKNWLFSGSPTGATASATIYSIIETCLANDIDPRDYFMYIFKHMPQEARLDDETVQKYLPWNTPMYLKDK